MSHLPHIPIFPLRIVVFPGELLNLHIFEPRYKQLVKDCVEQNMTFGIPSFIDGQVMTLGTEVRILNIENTHNNGEMDIRTMGINLFQMTNFQHKAPTKLYGTADIEALTFETSSGKTAISQRIIRLITELYQITGIQKQPPTDPANFVIFDYAHYCGLSIHQEYELLSIRSEAARQQYILLHLENLVPTLQEVEHMRKRAQLNGHFKKLVPPL